MNKHLCSIDEAMGLMKLSGRAAKAFRALLERDEPNAWFVVAARLRKASL